MSTNKNAYEIRAEILTLAKDYFDTIYRANKDFAEAALAQASKLNAQTLKELQAYQPVPYTTEDVLKMAKELYNFVGGSK